LDFFAATSSSKEVGDNGGVIGMSSSQGQALRWPKLRARRVSAYHHPLASGIMGDDLSEEEMKITQPLMEKIQKLWATPKKELSGLQLIRTSSSVGSSRWPLGPTVCGITPIVRTRHGFLPTN
jgi:hypothetical protein